MKLKIYNVNFGNTLVQYKRTVEGLKKAVWRYFSTLDMTNDDNSFNETTNSITEELSV